MRSVCTVVFTCIRFLFHLLQSFWSIPYYLLARKLWRDYFASGVDGVVFIVDATDRERFPEAKRELDVRNDRWCCVLFPTLSFWWDVVFIIFLQALLTSEELANVPFLILGNKIDLGRAASEEELRYQLGLFETYGKEVVCTRCRFKIIILVWPILCVNF